MKEKEIIVYDIDDTITDESGFILSYLPIYLKKKYNVEVELVNSEADKVSEVFNLKLKLEEKGLDESAINDIMKFVDKKFIQKNYLRYLMFPLKKDSKKILEFTNDKYINHFVTLRGVKPDKKETNLDLFVRTMLVPFLTRTQLYLNGIQYDDITFVKSLDDKAKKIKLINPSMVFDDTAAVINSVKGTSKIFVKTRRNRIGDLINNNNYVVDFNYDEVKNCIESIEQKNIKPKSRHVFIKNSNLSTVVLKNALYKLGKSTLGKIINLKVKPRVNGLENVPNDDNFIYVSNHRKSLDTVIQIINSKGVINFAAVNYLFSGKKNIFGDANNKLGCLFTKAVVNYTGSFPVARSDDKDYFAVNLQANEIMNEYLLEYNNSLGFYPEGTHNKDIVNNGELLPLVSDYIFDLSIKTGKKIVPVAVSWPSKDKNFPYKVLLDYGKPISGTTKSELKELWVNNVLEMLEKQNAEVDECSSEYSMKLKNNYK